MLHPFIAGMSRVTETPNPGSGGKGHPPRTYALRRYNLFATVHARSRWPSLTFVSLDGKLWVAIGCRPDSKELNDV